jgi:DNA-directed RNA polymerase subunit RPC12/RpoP
MNVQSIPRQNPKVSLKAILPPGRRPVVSAPPILIASTHTIDYCCAACGAVLLHAEVEQVHNLVIRCTLCGNYSTTDT